MAQRTGDESSISPIVPDRDDLPRRFRHGRERGAQRPLGGRHDLAKPDLLIPAQDRGIPDIGEIALEGLSRERSFEHLR
jgi:hypothetical protein